MLFRFVALIALGLFAFTGHAHAAAPNDGPSTVDLSQEPAAPDRVRANTTDSQRYAYQVTASNSRMQVRVNDVPVTFKIFRDLETVDISFNEWLKRGLNVVEIQMERFSDLTPYKVSYNVYFQSPSQIVTGERRVLFSSPEQVSLPMRQPVGIRAPTVANMRIWQTEKIEFTPEEKDRLVESLNSLRTRMIDALTKGDNAFLATFDKPIRDEIAKAYGRLGGSEQDTMKRRMELAEQLRKMVNANVNSSSELKAGELNFEVIGDGYLVRVTRLDGSPVIRISRGDLTFSVNKPIYGSVGGLWDMMRND